MRELYRYRDLVLQGVATLPSERLPASNALGRWLAEPVVARLAAPPNTCSAMDGYALRASDAPGPTSLPVVGTLYAGSVADRPLGPGEAVQIFTGAPLPAGADTVAMKEAVRREGDRVVLDKGVCPGENVRREGEDVPVGGVALPSGRRLGPRQLALCAAVGGDEVEVVRRPRVHVISTGDEIAGGHTPNSNGVAIAGLCSAIGAEVGSRVVGDDLDALEGALREGVERADAVVTIGGVSVGARDHVPGALSRLAADVRVHGVPMKPGKPFLFALLGGRPVFGLPGSPSACLVAFEVFVRPALLHMHGAQVSTRRTLKLPLAASLDGRRGRARLVWAQILPDGRVLPLGRDTAQVRGPALADALVCVPSGCGSLGEGEVVETWLLDADGP
jgi:molybdopterin molybdotransferase